MFTKEDFNEIQTVEDILELRGKSKWKDFEYFTKFFLENLGFKKVRISKNTYADFDLICFNKEDEKIAVECKAHSINKRHTENLAVRDLDVLGGRMLRNGIEKGIFMTTMLNHESAIKIADQYNIEIFGRYEIFEEINNEITKNTETKKIKISTYENDKISAKKNFSNNKEFKETINFYEENQYNKKKFLYNKKENKQKNELFPHTKKFFKILFYKYIDEIVYLFKK